MKEIKKKVYLGVLTHVTLSSGFECWRIGSFIIRYRFKDGEWRWGCFA
jgi:hypothetical protein